LSKGDNFMLALAQWFSETQASLAIQEHDWLIPLLQTIHILAIAMVLSSVFMIDLRILRVTKSQSMAATAHRFVPWIWAGIALLAASGMILIVGEPQRSLPNPHSRSKCCFWRLQSQRHALFKFRCGVRRRLGTIPAQSAPRPVFLRWAPSGCGAPSFSPGA
jgi:hypothetical protein